MTNDEALVLVSGLVCRARQLDSSQVSGSTNLVDDLGYDSLDAAELLAALHSETGRQLSVDSMDGIQTVSDIAQKLADDAARKEVS